MRNNFLILFCLILIFASGCQDNAPDTLGDLIVQLNRQSALPDNPLLNDVTLGIFPSESLLTNNFTSDLAFKTATVDATAESIAPVVFTNILPGTYLVAFVATSTDQNVPKQAVQIIADKVTVIDLHF